MDKVQKIRKEVERLKEETSIGLSEHENGVEQGRLEIIDALSLFLDSLQEEHVSEDLEEAIGEYCSNPDNFATWIGGDETDDISLIIKAIEFGAQWKKKQMMKNALISTIIEDLLYKSIVPTLQASIAEYKNGDKVKVIIVKED